MKNTYKGEKNLIKICICKISFKAFFSAYIILLCSLISPLESVFDISIKKWIWDLHY